MATLEDVKQDVDELYRYRDHYFENHSLEEASQKTKNLKTRLEKTLALLDQFNEEQSRKAEVLLLRGRALNVMPYYDEQVEECLSKTVKLSPKMSEAWIQLGESYWKKGDVKSAQNCFVGALNHCRDKVALRNLSMVTRQLSKTEADRSKMMDESLELAKEAVQLDVMDGTSWLVLGNAYLSMFFVKTQDPNTIKLCFSAYKQAERDVVTKANPDLHFNRATLYHYEEDYEKALIGFSQSLALDPTFKVAKMKEEMLLKYLRTFSSLIESKGKIPSKKLQSLVDSLDSSSDLGPYKDAAVRASSGASQKLTLCPLDQLEHGINPDKVVLGKVVCSFNIEEAVSFSFCIIDSCKRCLGVTVYNIASGWGVKIGDSVTIPQPNCLQIDFTYKKEHFKFCSIRVNSPVSLLVNGRRVGASSQSPPTLTLFAKSD